MISKLFWGKKSKQKEIQNGDEDDRIVQPPNYKTRFTPGFYLDYNIDRIIQYGEQNRDYISQNRQLINENYDMIEKANQKLNVLSTKIEEMQESNKLMITDIQMNMEIIKNWQTKVKSQQEMLERQVNYIEEKAQEIFRFYGQNKKTLQYISQFRIKQNELLKLPSKVDELLIQSTIMSRRDTDRLSSRIDGQLALITSDYKTLFEKKNELVNQIDQLRSQILQNNKKYIGFNSKFTELKTKFEVQSEIAKKGAFTLNQVVTKLKLYGNEFQRLQKQQNNIFNTLKQHNEQQQEIWKDLKKTKKQMKQNKSSLQKVIKDIREEAGEQARQTNKKINDIQNQTRKQYENMTSYTKQAQNFVRKQLSNMNSRYQHLLDGVNAISQIVLTNDFEQQMQNPIFRYDVWTGRRRRPNFQKFSVLDIVSNQKRQAVYRNENEK